MFEREQDFVRFVGWLTKGEHTNERISQESKIGLPTVIAYRDQAIGIPVVELNSDVPPEKLKSVVGFRYRRLPRWVYTDSIMHARQRYDDGHVEMAQGLYKVKGEDAWVLFAFERKFKRKSKFGSLEYFTAKID